MKTITIVRPTRGDAVQVAVTWDRTPRSTTVVEDRIFGKEGTIRVAATMNPPMPGLTSSDIESLANILPRALEYDPELRTMGTWRYANSPASGDEFVTVPDPAGSELKT